MEKVSVIIPCFNQGKYIEQSVNSVLKQSYKNIEIILVNDGSTDELTINKINEIEKWDRRIKIIHSENKGLANARNIGISFSTGEYILPLDADDYISETYIEEAIKIFKTQQETKLVYAKAKFFGERDEEWILPEYSYHRLLYENMIYCSAIYKKSDYLQTTGYNPNMKYGWEDWDFWLSLLSPQSIVVRINKIHFFYRVKKTSMIKSITKEQEMFLFKQLYQNHKEIYDKELEPIIFLKRELEKYKAGYLKYKNLYNTILNSKSYRVGHKIIKLLKWIKK